MAVTIVKAIQFKPPVKISGTFIIGQTLGTLRNNFTGAVGCKFSVSKNINVVALGRWVISGNSQSHTITIYDGTGVTLMATAVVNCSGAVAGAYIFAPITPLGLIAGSSYRLESTEVSGGDQWYDLNTTVITNSVGSVLTESAGHTGGGTQAAGHTYVPPNFLYR
jgi:hypothetical protein